MTVLKKFERMALFFGFCEDAGWIVKVTPRRSSRLRWSQSLPAWRKTSGPVVWRVSCL